MAKTTHPTRTRVVDIFYKNKTKVIFSNAY